MRRRICCKWTYLMQPGIAHVLKVGGCGVTCLEHVLQLNTKFGDRVLRLTSVLELTHMYVDTI